MVFTEDEIVKFCWGAMFVLQSFNTMKHSSADSAWKHISGDGSSMSASFIAIRGDS
jgi:hypothetical protein